MHPPPRFCLVNTNHAASGSSGPPFLLLQLLRGNKLSSLLSGRPDHGETERCQLLTIPRMHCMTIRPWQTVMGAFLIYSSDHFVWENIVLKPWWRKSHLLWAENYFAFWWSFLGSLCLQGKNNILDSMCDGAASFFVSARSRCLI